MPHIDIDIISKRYVIADDVIVNESPLRIRYTAATRITMGSCPLGHP